MTFTRLILLSCGIALSSACSGGGPTGPAPVSSISISATASTVKAEKTVLLTAQSKDAGGNPLSGRTVTWTTSNASVATVASNGTVTGVGAGTAVITATSEGVTSQITITVTRAAIATITIAISPAQIGIGGTAQATASVVDSTGKAVTDAVLTWSSSDQNVATVNSSGLVTGVGSGTARIDARAEGILGSANVTVSGTQANCTTSLTLSFGEVRTLLSTQKSLFCVTGATTEYVMIPFNNSSVAASTIPVNVSGLNTSSPVSITGNLQVAPSGLHSPLNATLQARAAELAFRVREHEDLKPAIASMRGMSSSLRDIVPSHITGIPAAPTVGQIFPINVNLVGNTCSAAKVLHPAMVVAVLPHVIVLADTLAPAGGYTSAEMAAFGQAFEVTGYGLDTLNFGAPSDIDNNGAVAVLFTPGVNTIPTSPGTVVLGLQAGRDVFPLSLCQGSNEGEMFYLPVPDLNRTLNGNYINKASLSNGVQGTLVHEFQHLINIGRRAYVNNADVSEEVWLNEGLSHIAEELLYYKVSGNTPGQNVDLPKVQSSQAQLDAINAYQVSNLGRLRSYMTAPETNSPYAQNDDLATRGATWQLLRYAADRKGGPGADTWRALVNSTTAGTANFNAVFGNIVTQTRDWAVAQYVDDTGLGVPSIYTNPSWNFRSLEPAINSGVFPLLTRSLGNLPIDITLVGGGAAYVRFQVSTSPATITLTSSGQALPAGVDVILVRTK